MSARHMTQPIEVVVRQRDVTVITCDGPGCTWSFSVTPDEPRRAFLGNRYAVSRGSGQFWADPPELHFCGSACMEAWAHLDVARMARAGRREVD